MHEVQLYVLRLCCFEVCVAQIFISIALRYHWTFLEPVRWIRYVRRFGVETLCVFDTNGSNNGPHRPLVGCTKW